MVVGVVVSVAVEMVMAVVVVRPSGMDVFAAIAVVVGMGMIVWMVQRRGLLVLVHRRAMIVLVQHSTFAMLDQRSILPTLVQIPLMPMAAMIAVGPRLGNEGRHLPTDREPHPDEHVLKHLVRKKPDVQVPDLHRRMAVAEVEASPGKGRPVRGRGRHHLLSEAPHPDQRPPVLGGQHVPFGQNAPPREEYSRRGAIVQRHALPAAHAAFMVQGEACRRGRLGPRPQIAHQFQHDGQKSW
jgi:hypothetical protein